VDKVAKNTVDSHVQHNVEHGHEREHVQPTLSSERPLLDTMATIQGVAHNQSLTSQLHRNSSTNSHEASDLRSPATTTFKSRVSSLFSAKPSTSQPRADASVNADLAASRPLRQAWPIRNRTEAELDPGLKLRRSLQRLKQQKSLIHLDFAMSPKSFGQQNKCDNTGLLTWLKQSISPESVSKIFVIRNQQQLERLIYSVRISDSGQTLEKAPGELLQALHSASHKNALGCVIVIDEPGFSATELEGLNELKQNGLLAGEALKRPPLVISLIDQIAQAEGRRSSALVSRADYAVVSDSEISRVSRGVNELLALAETTNGSAELASEPNSTMSIDVINCFDGSVDWRDLLLPSPQLTDEGWALTDPLTPSDSSECHRLIIRQPPLDDPEFCDFITQKRQEFAEQGLAIQLELQGPPSIAELTAQSNNKTSNKLAQSSMQDCIRVDAHNLSSLLSKTIMEYDQHAFLTKGVLAQNHDEPLHIFVDSQLSLQQWTQLLTCPRAINIQLGAEVYPPANLKQIPLVSQMLDQPSIQLPKPDAMRLDTILTSDVGEHTGIFALNMSSDAFIKQQGCYKSSADQATIEHVFVTPQTSTAELFARLSFHPKPDQGLSLNDFQQKRSQVASDLVQGKTVVLHNLEHNPSLVSDLACLTSSMGQLHAGGTVFHWPTTQPKFHNTQVLLGRILALGPSLVDKALPLLIPTDKASIKMHLPIKMPLDDTQTLTQHRRIEDVHLLEIAHALIDNRGVFVQGEPGVGKTYSAYRLAQLQAMELIKVGVDDIKAGGLHQALAQWATPCNHFKYTGRLLVIDEANLASKGDLDGLKELFLRDQLLVDGQRVDVPKHHKLIMTGNAEHLQGRVSHSVVQQYMPILQLKPLSSQGLGQVFVDKVGQTLKPVLQASTSELSQQQRQKLLKAHQVLVKAFGESVTPRALQQTTVGVLLRQARGIDAKTAMAQAVYQTYIAGQPVVCQQLLKPWLVDTFGTDGLLALESSSINWPMNTQIIDSKSTAQLGKQVDHWLLEQITLGQLPAAQRPGQRALLIEGPAGRGKDQVVAARLAYHQVDALYINASTDIEQLRTALTHAKQAGQTLVVSELNLLPSSFLESELNATLNGDDACVHPDFRLIATVNPSEDYQGRQTLSTALKSRMTQICLEDYPVQDQLMLVEHSLGNSALTSNAAKALVTGHRQLVAQLSARPGLPSPTTRELLKAASCLQSALPRLISGEPNTLSTTDSGNASLTQAVDQVIAMTYQYYQDQIQLADTLSSTSKPADKPIRQALELLPVLYSAFKDLNEIDVVADVERTPTLQALDNRLLYRGPLTSEALVKAFNTGLLPEPASAPEAVQDVAPVQALTLKPAPNMALPPVQAKPTQAQLDYNLAEYAAMMNQSPLGSVQCFDGADRALDQSSFQLPAIVTGYMTIKGNPWRPSSKTGSEVGIDGLQSIHKAVIQYPARAQDKAQRRLLVPQGFQLLSAYAIMSDQKKIEVKPHYNPSTGLYKASVPLGTTTLELVLTPGKEPYRSQSGLSLKSQHCFESIQSITTKFSTKIALDLQAHPGFAHTVAQLQVQQQQGAPDKAIAQALKTYMTSTVANFRYSLAFEALDCKRSVQSQCQTLLSRRAAQCKGYAALTASVLHSQFGLDTRIAHGHTIKQKQNQTVVSGTAHAWCEYFDRQCQVWRPLDTTASQVTDDLQALDAQLKAFEPSQPRVDQPRQVSPREKVLELERARQREFVGWSGDIEHLIHLPKMQRIVKTLKAKHVPIQQKQQYNSVGRGQFDALKAVAGQQACYRQSQLSHDQHALVLNLDLSERFRFNKICSSTFPVNNIHLQAEMFHHALPPQDFTVLNAEDSIQFIEQAAHMINKAMLVELRQELNLYLSHDTAWQASSKFDQLLVAKNWLQGCQFNPSFPIQVNGRDQPITEENVQRVQPFSIKLNHLVRLFNDSVRDSFVENEGLKVACQALVKSDFKSTYTLRRIGLPVVREIKPKQETNTALHGIARLRAIIQQQGLVDNTSEALLLKQAQALLANAAKTAQTSKYSAASGECLTCIYALLPFITRVDTVRQIMTDIVKTQAGLGQDSPTTSVCNLFAQLYDLNKSMIFYQRQIFPPVA